MADAPTKRPPGRPPLRAGERSIEIGVSVPQSTFDQLCVLAKKHDVSLPAVVRKALDLATRRQPE